MERAEVSEEMLGWVVRWWSPTELGAQTGFSEQKSLS